MFFTCIYNIQTKIICKIINEVQKIINRYMKLYINSTKAIYMNEKKKSKRTSLSLLLQFNFKEFASMFL